jgi:hypothetical protein
MGKPSTIRFEGKRPRFFGHENQGSVIAKRLLRRLRFSRLVVRAISGMIKDHHRAFMLFSIKKRSFRAKAHFFSSTRGVHGVMLLLLAIADARATRGSGDKRLFAFVEDMLRFYSRECLRQRPRPVLNGNEVMEIFKVKEGPIVGEILNKVSEAIELGIARDRAGAVLYAKDWLKQKELG